MSTVLDRTLVDSLFPADLPDTGHWEQRYPPRDLPEGAEVTRFSPSPTGFVHIGGIYVAMIDRDVAGASGGRYLLRVEDTDQAREVAGALEQFDLALGYFGLLPQESDQPADGALPEGAPTPDGAYGPYRQSARWQIYASYVRELLRTGAAYLCFATREELGELTARQQAAKVPTGYYGQWAPWRDADQATVEAQLAAGVPWVVRLRVPDDAPPRTGFDDVIRGRLEQETNRNDVVILKTSAVEPRLPTYHFAHAVDDHLMQVTTVIRGEEWISSVSTHLQLFAALGFPPVRYAHIAPLMKIIPGGKRKLSKRKDPEANVEYYVAAGYPPPAVEYYLRGLANGRLAEMPLPEALATPIRLQDCNVAGPLVDLVKLADISADHIATLDEQTIAGELATWAERYDPPVAAVLAARPELTLAALRVERVDVPNPRKDLRMWSDFRTAYGFFYAELLDELRGADDPRIVALSVTPEVAEGLLARVADGYGHDLGPDEWFGQIRSAAAAQGFAPNPKALKADPGAYPGSIREASQLVRLALTGSTRSPDLYAIAQVLGAEETVRRLRVLGRAAS